MSREEESFAVYSSQRRAFESHQKGWCSGDDEGYRASLQTPSTWVETYDTRPSTSLDRTPQITSSKQKRLRTAFTTQQINILEENFAKCHYVTRPVRIELANLLGLQDKAIKVWFQNRRMKHKKEGQRVDPNIFCSSTTDDDQIDQDLGSWDKKFYDINGPTSSLLGDNAVDNLGTLVAQCMSGNEEVYPDALTSTIIEDCDLHVDQLSSVDMTERPWHQTELNNYNIHYIN